MSHDDWVEDLGGAGEPEWKTPKAEESPMATPVNPLAPPVGRKETDAEWAERLWRIREANIRRRAVFNAGRRAAGEVEATFDEWRVMPGQVVGSDGEVV